MYDILRIVQVEIKIYKQRVKHLLFEQQNELAKKKMELEIALKLAQDDYRTAESDLKADGRALKKVSCNASTCLC
jgi:hypothetical protein